MGKEDHSWCLQRIEQLEKIVAELNRESDDSHLREISLIQKISKMGTVVQEQEATVSVLREALKNSQIVIDNYATQYRNEYTPPKQHPQYADNEKALSATPAANLEAVKREARIEGMERAAGMNDNSAKAIKKPVKGMHPHNQSMNESLAIGLEILAKEIRAEIQRMKEGE